MLIKYKVSINNQVLFNHDYNNGKIFELCKFFANYFSTFKYF